ncbi:MAG: hypothetical protein HYT85_18875 [candidate division NC10 bacterium]|nr:hypothetical protein [candidate division NC10 bacterium]MBI2117123.1 hypothetical protein [candidate division NC10 bacterium]
MAIGAEKAVVLYVADAFEVMRKVNALLGKKSAGKIRGKACRDREAESRYVHFVNNDYYGFMD